LIKSSQIVTTQTYTGRYPPLYYLIVGLPSLLFKSTTGFYLMRMISAILSASMIGLAIYSIKRWSSNDMLPLGIMLAATPMVIYLGGMVNPNGLEISSSICLWVVGLIIFTEHRRDLPKGLLIITCLSAATLTLMRGLSPLWTLLILTAVISLGSWSDIRKLLHSRREVKIAACSSLTVGVIAITWVIADHSLDLLNAGQQVSANESTVHILLASLNSVWSWFPQMIGIFGSLDTYAPAWVIDTWLIVIGISFIIGLYFSKKRQRFVLISTVVLGILIAVVLQYKQARQVGLVWQGRYLLPIIVGVPIMSSAILDNSIKNNKPKRIIGILLALLLGSLGLVSILQALKRYAVGAHGSFSLVDKWSPPGGYVLIIGTSVVVSFAFVTSLLVCCWTQSTYPRLRYRSVKNKIQY
jgi:hypothetical protein